MSFFFFFLYKLSSKRFLSTCNSNKISSNTFPQITVLAMHVFLVNYNLFTHTHDNTPILIMILILLTQQLLFLATYSASQSSQLNTDPVTTRKDLQITSTIESRTVKKVLSKPKWCQVMKEEYKAIIKTDTLILVDLPPSCKVIRCK